MNTETIDTGDHVAHGPTGETWIVARVEGDRLAWLGWPEGWADLADCTLVQKAAPCEYEKCLHDLAASKWHHCAAWARDRLAKDAEAR